ncbi:dihydrodipicolinate synthase family protein [Natronolimnobius baerhuensis]|uniref:Dihydrodipicolinate synthase family protein n=1 Tax=Natronolimnobius baerhuensis TaxID=253108 RepID=A0A202E415_9EURY|nr:dihydrodipicolinate synthase family protein [Natronolimnobius baerhuensis]OVE82992.1 dihydrodipicolinate synthase family protein [Natronolimnobius baerhuensis]
MAFETEQVKERLRGVAVGVLTPFDQDGEIDHWKIEENVASLYDQGIRTFLAAANISEYHSLSQTERIAVTETAVDALPTDACVLAGVGGSTSAAQDLIRAYDDIGVDAMMVMPPDHTYIHEQGLLDYHRELGTVSAAPLVPYIRGYEPSVEYLAQLTRLECVVGIKYALEDAVTLGASISAGADDVVWVNGLAEPYAVAFWAEGVEGFSAGVSNFRPEIGLALFAALSNEEWDRARDLRDLCLPYQNFREGTGEDNSIAGAVSVPAVKQGLEFAGLHGGAVRDPIRSLTDHDHERLESLYSDLADGVDRLIDGYSLERIKYGTA